MPYTLIHSPVSRDTVTALLELLHSAQEGHLRGVAFVGLLRGRKFVVDCTGSACEDPTLTRGVLASLDDELQRLIEGRVDRDTTI